MERLRRLEHGVVSADTGQGELRVGEPGKAGGGIPFKTPGLVRGAAALEACAGREAQAPAAGSRGGLRAVKQPLWSRSGAAVSAAWALRVLLVMAGLSPVQAAGTAPAPGLEGAGAAASKILGECKVLPKIVVLDLDYTLWDCFNAAATTPPYRRTGPAEVRDANGAGQRIRIGTDTHAILSALRAHGCRVGVASLNGDLAKSRALLDALGVARFVDRALVQVVAARGKEQHLRAIKAAAGAGVGWGDLLLLDDAHHNVAQARRLGATGVLVEGRCLSLPLLQRALTAHAAEQRNRGALLNFFRAASPREGPQGQGAADVAPPPGARRQVEGRSEGAEAGDKLGRKRAPGEGAGGEEVEEACDAEKEKEEVKEEKEAEREEAGEAWHSSEGFRDVPASLLSSTSSVAGGRAGVKRARVMLGGGANSPRDDTGGGGA